ncbi:hypothetical protein ACFVTY_33000 [Streptomyces sp. NPDC058067]|uniref:hypothetical protein n=1 Tax=Streptomyces sp. NPDC058067 TaxID=3346324 RepID=UPI0036E0367B
MLRTRFTDEFGIECPIVQGGASRGSGAAESESSAFRDIPTRDEQARAAAPAPVAS